MADKNTPGISRELMGKIVDEVFGGAIEDCSVIEEIYAVIKHHEAEEYPTTTVNLLPSESPWQWWAGAGEEWLTVGPEDTREAIISTATNGRLGEFEHDGGGWNLSFYIVEERKDPLRLADWIHACDLIGHAEDCLADSDRVASEFDEGPWFTCSTPQKKDLQERINRACDEWQEAHGLIFSCATFSHTRNEEHVIVELHDDRTATEGSDNGL